MSLYWWIVIIQLWALWAVDALSQSRFVDKNLRSSLMQLLKKNEGSEGKLSRNRKYRDTVETETETENTWEENYSNILNKLQKIYETME